MWCMLNRKSKMVEIPFIWWYIPNISEMVANISGQYSSLKRGL